MIHIPRKLIVLLFIIQNLLYGCASNKQLLFQSGVYEWNGPRGIWYEEMKIDGDKVNVWGGGCVRDFYGKGRIIVVSDSCAIIDFARYMHNEGVRHNYIDSLRVHRNKENKLVFNSFDLVENSNANKEFNKKYFKNIFDTKIRYMHYKQRMKKKKNRNKKNEA